VTQAVDIGHFLGSSGEGLVGTDEGGVAASEQIHNRSNHAVLRRRTAYCANGGPDKGACASRKDSQHDGECADLHYGVVK
jgi:hypothetical protein